ncbi:hypothetical protein QBC44DRAFT_370833 [Cladorrhinum sp. PSN332]|nr:hypothetical protein QBC44DRAFT_370833 [Cladorrhinum sp. PSN332]
MPAISEESGQVPKSPAVSKSKSGTVKGKKPTKRSESNKSPVKKPEAKKQETKRPKSMEPETKEIENKRTDAKESDAQETDLEKSESKKQETRLPEIRVTEPEDSEQWSEWYVGEDRQHLWRARQLPDGTWDYEYQPLEGQPGQPRSRSQETNTTTTTYLTQSSQGNPVFPGLSPPASSFGRPPRSSPKSSYPTIITTSTGRPTEKYPTSSPRASAFLVREDLPILTITADPDRIPPLQQLVVPQTTSSKQLHPRRPIGPVMWLLQEGARSRKSKSSAAATTNTKLLPIHDPQQQQPPPPHLTHDPHLTAQQHPDQQQSQPHSQPTPQTIAQITKTWTAYAKKLDKKIKSEKVIRMDPRKRIKAWLKQVEVDYDAIPIPLDEDGFPIYR